MICSWLNHTDNVDPSCFKYVQLFSTIFRYPFQHRLVDVFYLKNSWASGGIVTYNTRDLGIVSPDIWSLYPFFESEPFTSILLKSWSSPSPSTGKGRNRPPSRPDLGGILMKRNPQTRRGVSQEWSQTLIWVCPAAHHSSHSCCKSDTVSSSAVASVASVASANRPRFIESKQHAIYVLRFIHAIWSKRGTVLGYPECRCIL